MVQENRSFDHYFAQLNTYRVAHGYGGPSDIDVEPPNASNPADDGTTIHAFHLKTVCLEELTPDWLESHVDFNMGDPGSDGPLMNGFVHNAGGMSTFLGESDTRGVRAMGYYDDSDLPYYYFMASQFATSDRWFSPLSSNSEVNRIYLQSGTSHGHAHKPTSDHPCCPQPTIYHLLDQAGISWKIYYSDSNAAGPIVDLRYYWAGFASTHLANIVPVSQYFTDVANGTLPAVAFIQAGLNSGRDEHPGGQLSPDVGGNNPQVGAKYVSSLINALMASPSWKDSVFIWSFDEGGGLYDHYPPQPAVQPDGIPPQDLLPKDASIQPPADFTRTGFRIPLIVVSPFTKSHYVSHTVADSTAILKLIETRFNLPNLTARDAAQPDMTEFFDFQNVPWAVPPVPPAQPTDGTCDPKLLPSSP